MPVKKKTTDDKKEAAPKKKAARARAAPEIEDPRHLPQLMLRSGVTKENKRAVLTGVMVNVRKSLQVLTARTSARPLRLYTPALLRKALIPYPELPFQHMLGSIGFRHQTAVELVGQAHVGKTSFVFDWIGKLLDQGCYSIYIECERKQADPAWVMALLDRDPELAALKLNSITFASAATLDESMGIMRKALPDLRKRCDENPETRGNPIFVFVDPVSSLMAAPEAAGVSEWGMDKGAKEKAKAPKDISTMANMGHARFASVQARILGGMLEQHNANIVFVKATRDKVDMQASRRPGFLPDPEYKNDTSIGGRALQGFCSYRFTLTKFSDLRRLKGDKAVIGTHTRLHCIKNSYGPRERSCLFTVRFDDHADSPEAYSPRLEFGTQGAAWLVKNGILGTRVDDRLYTSDALGCVAVSAQELWRALNDDPAQLDFVGGSLGIEGYSENQIASRERRMAQFAAEEGDVDADGETDEIVP
jgi:RecA/RadA recombinase